MFWCSRYLSAGLSDPLTSQYIGSSCLSLLWLPAPHLVVVASEGCTKHDHGWKIQSEWGRRFFWVPVGISIPAEVQAWDWVEGWRAGSHSQQRGLSQPFWALCTGSLLLLQTPGPLFHIGLEWKCQVHTSLLLLASCIFFPCLGSCFPPSGWRYAARAT